MTIAERRVGRPGNGQIKSSAAVSEVACFQAQPSARPAVLARSVTMNFAQQFESSEDGTVKLTVKPAMPLELTPSQVQSLSWQQHASIWKVSCTPSTPKDVLRSSEPETSLSPPAIKRVKQ